MRCRVSIASFDFCDKLFDGGPPTITIAGIFFAAAQFWNRIYLCLFSDFDTNTQYEPCISNIDFDVIALFMCELGLRYSIYCLWRYFDGSNQDR